MVKQFVGVALKKKKKMTRVKAVKEGGESMEKANNGSICGCRAQQGEKYPTNREINTCSNCMTVNSQITEMLVSRNIANESSHIFLFLQHTHELT